MSFLQKIFGPDPEIEKQVAFQEIERQFKDNKINKAKAGWLTMRGNNYAMSRKFDMAILDFKEALEYEQNRPSTLISLGGAYNHKEAYKEGISILEKTKELLTYIESDFLRNTQEHNLYCELGNAYFFTDDKELAVENLTKSLEAANKLKNLYRKGNITEKEWTEIERIIIPQIKNTEWLLSRIRP